MFFIKIASISKKGEKRQKHFSNIEDAIAWRKKQERELYG